MSPGQTEGTFAGACSHGRDCVDTAGKPLQELREHRIEQGMERIQDTDSGSFGKETTSPPTNARVTPTVTRPRGHGDDGPRGISG